MAGCDEELWSKLTNKKNLIKLMRKGDEERGRERIQSLRNLVAEEEKQVGLISGNQWEPVVINCNQL